MICTYCVRNAKRFPFTHKGVKIEEFRCHIHKWPVMIKCSDKEFQHVFPLTQDEYESIKDSFKTKDIFIDYFEYAKENRTVK